MPAASKKRPPMEAEPGKGKAHEMKESPAEETREGAEPDHKPLFKTNRKRSAKNAHNTKAPMDDDCGCGGNGIKGKASCDGNCGGYAKKDRSDALTPQEYLAACELGIQGRSRAYIRARLDAAAGALTMALTPSTIRADLKCGNGSISEGEKCHKGTATKAKKYQPNFADRINAAVNTVGSIYSFGIGAANLGLAAQHRSGGHAIAGAGQLLAGGLGLKGSSEYLKGRKLSGDLYSLGAMGTAMGASALGQAVAESDFRRRQANQFVKNQYKGSDPFADLGISKKATPAQARAAYLKLAREHHPDRGGDAAKFRKAKEAYEEIMRRSGRKDSIWAVGFVP